MFDPDVPRRKNPIQKGLQQWIVVNIPEANVEKGYALSAYIPPLPLKFTEYHRYIFLVYKQPSLVVFKEPNRNASDISTRMNFSLDKFTKKYRLDIPIAGNFFESEFDSSVPAAVRRIILNIY